MSNKTKIRTLIRQIVREEVAMSIQEVITEMKKPSLSSLEKAGSETSPTPQQVVSKPKRNGTKIVEKKSFTKNSVLNDVLNETAQSEEWKTMGGETYDSSKMNQVIGSSYGDMMNNDSNTNLAMEMGVDPNDPAMDFLKKDYRKVLKKVEEKSKQKRGL